MTGLCLGSENRRRSPVYSIHALLPFHYYFSFDVWGLNENTSQKCSSVFTSSKFKGMDQCLGWCRQSTQEWL